MIKKIVIILTLALWPINLYLANIQSDFVSYSVPVVLLLTSFFLYKKYPKYYLIPIILIGLFEKKLVLLPVIFCIFELVTHFSKKTLAFLIVSIGIFVGLLPSYKGQTVFNKDYEAQQLILRNINLYPNIFTARLFQNKAKVYLGKITNNFFTLTDPNNYFFASHPAQTTTSNQDLYKFPFIPIIFLLYGIYFIKDNSNRKFILFSCISAVLSLIVLNNFDRNDFILWVPISLVIIHGINHISKEHKKFWIFLVILFIVFTIPEFLRSFIEKIL